MAVVGAGVSIAATDRNPLASWQGLLLHGVDRCVELSKNLPPGWAQRQKDAIEHGALSELIAAAEVVSEQLGAPKGGEFRIWLRETVGALRAQDPALIEALRGLDLVLATTNYDGLLEDPPALPAVTWCESARVERVVRGDEKGILHLHGHWRDPESVILGIRSYERVLGDAHAQALQQAFRSMRTLLFVGCGEGLRDPNFEALRSWSRKAFPGSEYRHFRLCRDSEAAILEEEHSEEERIFPLPYGPGYGDLAGFLRSLKPPSLIAPAFTGPKTPGRPRLPVRRNCFGREAEVDDLVESLCAAPPPPVPILGQAGIGKSTVLIEARHRTRVEERYGDRRFFVSCDSASDRESLLGEIARALKVGPGPTRDEKLFAELERGRIVLGLDNPDAAYWAETPGVEELLAQLAAVPGLALAISLRGEERPFGTPWREAIRLLPLSRVAARSAFLQVAGEKFRGDPDLEKVLDVIDGWPLALTLLAHRAQVESSLSGLLALWVAKRTEILRRGDERSRLNIDVSLGLSIESPRMTAEALRLLSLLSVLPEGIVLENLDDLFPQALEAAPRLRQVGLALDTSGRLRALAPVREYVQERHPGPHEDLQRAVDYYLRWAQESQMKLESNILELSSHLEQEFGNLEALVIASLTPQPAEPDSTDGTSEKIRSVLSLGSLLTSTGLSPRAARIAGKALQRADEIGDQSLKIECLILLGEIARVRTQWDEARSHFAASLELSRKLGDLYLQAVGIYDLGDVEVGQSNLAPARSAFEEARKLFAALGQTDWEGKCLLGLAKIHRESGDFDAATSLAQEAVALSAGTRVDLWAANCGNLLAELALLQGDAARATEHVESAQEIYEKRFSALGRANCLTIRARIAQHGRSSDLAVSLFHDALELYELIGHQRGKAECLYGLGELSQGDPAAARAKFLEALELFLHAGDPYQIGRGHAAASRVAASESERLSHLQQAREAWYRIGRFDLVEELERNG